MAQPPLNSLKISPLGEVDSRQISQMGRPPAIIPIATIPPHILAQFPLAAAHNGGPSLMLQTQSHPQAQLRRAPITPAGQFRSLATESLPARLPTTYQGSSPEEEGEDEVSCGGDTRHNRRREMNRIAQQKSRHKKDQAIKDLQIENDQLKAKIISLDAEIKVWKNMTKKSENETNELRRRLEEKEEKIQEQLKMIRRLNNRHLDELDDLSAKGAELDEEDTMDGLQIDDQVGEKAADLLDHPEKVEPELIIESRSTPETTKEIQSLTTELQRMYTLTNQQAETNKLLHQALDDQQRRFRLYEKREGGISPLEMSTIHQIAVAPAKKLNKAKNRWIRRNVSRGISKCRIDKPISRLIKNGSLR